MVRTLGIGCSTSSGFVSPIIPPLTLSGIAKPRAASKQTLHGPGDSQSLIAKKSPCKESECYDGTAENLRLLHFFSNEQGWPILEGPFQSGWFGKDS